MELHGTVSWNYMENVLILHGISWRIFHGTPWNSEVFHTGGTRCPMSPAKTVVLRNVMIPCRTGNISHAWDRSPINLLRHVFRVH